MAAIESLSIIADLSSSSSSSTENLLELGRHLDKFLFGGMRENRLTAEQIKEVREKDCIKVTVHETECELLSLKKLVKKFQQDSCKRETRIAVPSRDILLLYMMRSVTDKNFLHLQPHPDHSTKLSSFPSL